MKREIILIFMILVSLNFVLAAEVSYCCEKTVEGAWCQNAPQDECADGYRSIPASCEATSYCKLGTCIDSQEGTCLENTPQQVCQDEGGVWRDDDVDEIPQCQLGCCLLGDQAAFVTQTRCERLSSVYSLETNFRSDVQNEFQCISLATSDVKGACVFEEDFQKDCRFISQRECNEMASTNENVSFYKDTLCSDEALGTICGPTKDTTCVEGRDEVYFVDSCGNLANVYDARKINDKIYWSEVIDPLEACNPNSPNADSATCGNCDYYLGTTCKEFSRSEDKVKPNYGDYICRDLSCEWEGQTYQHGETWCAGSEGTTEIVADRTVEPDNSNENLPGSRYFRAVCYNGDVTIEPCADYRQEICIQDSVNDFSTAACRVNEWQDCYAQDNQLDCENVDRRDCKWSEVTFGNLNESQDGGECIPLYAPGLDFWEEGQAEEICSLATTQCVVKFRKGLLGEAECVENCECLDAGWEDLMNNACIALGDCGMSTNYIGVKGYHDGKAVYTKADGTTTKDVEETRVFNR